MNAAPSIELRSQFGDIDIYLFDQLLRGRFDGRRRILDAGCGSGRNLPFLLSRGFEVFAIDEDPSKASPEGVIGFQMHTGPPFKIEYRNVMLKKIQ